MTGSVSAGRGTATVTRDAYGTLADGTTVERFVVRAGALAMAAITYGATITSLHAPDAAGRAEDVVLGFDTLDEYVRSSPYFGAVVGRYANRIGHGRVPVNGQVHQVTRNDGVNHLHGGARGFDKVVWAAEPLRRDDSAGVAFTRTSPDGEEGYPGTLAARVEYLLTPQNELVVRYEATTDRATVINLTQHSYFDLSAGRRADIGSHELMIVSHAITAVDAGLIPTGALMPVSGTPFDFRRPMPIGARVNEPDEQLRRAGGYDHNFVLDGGSDGETLRHAATLREPSSGRTLDVHTSEPGLQFYSGNFLDGSLRGKEGRVYAHRSGLCLETQHFPDSPNQPGFPSVLLAPGDVYRSHTTYAFGTRGSADTKGGTT